MHSELSLVHNQKQIFHFEDVFGMQNFDLVCSSIKNIRIYDSFYNTRYMVLNGPRFRSQSRAQTGPALTAKGRYRCMGGALALVERYQHAFTILCRQVSTLRSKYLKVCFDIHDIAAEPDSFQIESFQIKPLAGIQISRAREYAIAAYILARRGSSERGGRGCGSSASC